MSFAVVSREEMMVDVFDLEPRTPVPRGSSYISSYPYLLSYFTSKEVLEPADLVRGAHMAYGWMPTILELYPEPPNLDLVGGAQLLTRAKHDGALSDADLCSLASLINNSLVGASKLLHFVAPTQFAIWDSKIYAFVFEEKPHSHRVQKVANYRHCLNRLVQLQNDPRFDTFHESVNAKVGYDVSSLRALELVMFLNAPVFAA
jgi:hypothetical protein